MMKTKLIQRLRSSFLAINTQQALDVQNPTCHFAARVADAYLYRFIAYHFIGDEKNWKNILRIKRINITTVGCILSGYSSGVIAKAQLPDANFRNNTINARRALLPYNEFTKTSSS